MSASVCVSVCLSQSVCCLSAVPRAYLQNHTRDLYLIFMHVAYRRGSVILGRGDEIPMKIGNFGGFRSHCIA